MLNKWKKKLGGAEKLLVHNPKIPRLHCLLKEHKPVNDTSPNMRPIGDNIDAPNSKVAKWLLKRFQDLPKPFSFSVKNSMDFVEKLKDVVIYEDEIMVVFKVTSLYPNVPIEKSIVYTAD